MIEDEEKEPRRRQAQPRMSKQTAAIAGTRAGQATSKLPEIELLRAVPQSPKTQQPANGVSLVTVLQRRLEEATKEFTGRQNPISQFILIHGAGLKELTEARGPDATKKNFAALNQVLPGAIYMDPKLLRSVVEKTVIAACSFDKARILDAKEWLRAVCVPRAPQTERPRLSLLHLLDYPQLYAEVKFLNVLSVGLMRNGTNVSRARASIAEHVPGFNDIPSPILDIVVVLPGGGRRASSSSVSPVFAAAGIMAMATGYTADLTERRGETVSGYGPTLIRNRVAALIPEWQALRDGIGALAERKAAEVLKGMRV